MLSPAVKLKYYFIANKSNPNIEIYAFCATDQIAEEIAKLVFGTDKFAYNSSEVYHDDLIPFPKSETRQGYCVARYEQFLGDMYVDPYHLYKKLV